MALFVPLDASYPQDPKILDLDDERSELLFIRSLAYCKAHLTDGLIHRRALHQIAPFADDVHADDLAADLVRTGLWTETDRGWRVTAWLKRNPASEEILTPNTGRELAHKRHHEKKGIQKEGCPFCFPVVEEPQVAAHDAVRIAEHAVPEPEPYPEPEPSSSSPQTTCSGGTDADPDAAAGDREQTIRAAAVAVGRAEALTHGGTSGYAASVTKRILTDPDRTDRDRIRLLVDQGQTPEQIAAGWQTDPFGTMPGVDLVAQARATADAAERAKRREAETADRLAAQRAETRSAPPADLRRGLRAVDDPPPSPERSERMTFQIHECIYVPGAEMAYCSCGWEHAGEDEGDCDEAFEGHCCETFDAHTAPPPSPATREANA